MQDKREDKCLKGWKIEKKIVNLRELDAHADARGTVCASKFV